MQVYSDSIAAPGNTIVGVEGSDFDFAELLKHGHIELTRASIAAVSIVTPAVREKLGYMDFLHAAQSANALSGRVVDWISGNYSYKMGVGKLRKLGESPYKHQFPSMSFADRDIAWAAGCHGCTTPRTDQPVRQSIP